MPATQRLVDRVRADADRMLRGVAHDVRGARIGAGLSQREAGGAVGMSHSEYGRLERMELEHPTVEQLALACASVGLRLVVKAYPAGDPARDAVQLRLAARFATLLPPTASWRTEVPLPQPGDLRAWDGLAALDGREIGAEIESRLYDVQALERRIALKQRDGGISLVVLVVADTRTNRRVLADHRDALRTRFPLDGREILAAFRAGRLPEASGILLL